MNSIAIILGITLMYATPLIYTSLGGAMSENAGVVNIGLEGMMTFGALIAATVAYYTKNPWLGFFAGGLGGMFLALLHAIATVSFQADHVISGTAINFIGPGLSLFLCRAFFEGAAQTRTVPSEGLMPKPLSGVFTQNSIPDIILNQPITVYLAFLTVAIIWFVLFKTKLGLRIRSVGEHPKAADTLGINVKKIKYISVLASGFLAGLGGASLSIAIVSSYRVSLVSGQGFIALAALIFGNWKPQGAFASCLIFGLAQGLVVFFGQRGVNTALINMLPYALTMIVLIVFVGESRGPSANGVPYEKE
ncbi:MAG: ABC transporter permease [Tissierellia bacterium]|nr:ABC transporter permease [Tissierellia bacterium]